MFIITGWGFILLLLMVRKGDILKTIFCILGASGTGKTSLSRDLEIPELISHTTREKREDEIDGVDYYFVNEEELEELDLVEKVTYSDNQYGLSLQEIENKFKESDNVFVVIDKQGIEQLKKLDKYNIDVIYIKVDIFTAYDRLLERDSEEKANKRILNALYNKEFRNEGMANYVLENYNFDKAKDLLQKYIKAKIVVYR